jgi:hypothetical protein
MTHMCTYGWAVKGGKTARGVSALLVLVQSRYEGCIAPVCPSNGMDPSWFIQGHCA